MVTNEKIGIGFVDGVFNGGNSLFTRRYVFRRRKFV